MEVKEFDDKKEADQVRRIFHELGKEEADLTKMVKEETGRKNDTGKLRFDLVPPECLQELVAVYTNGAAEYGDYNWMKGLHFSRVFAAINRHLWDFWGGKDKDKDSGLLHLAHAAWGCFTLMYYLKHSETYDRFDDRR